MTAHINDIRQRWRSLERDSAMEEIFGQCSNMAIPLELGVEFLETATPGLSQPAHCFATVNVTKEMTIEL